MNANETDAGFRVSIRGGGRAIELIVARLARVFHGDAAPSPPVRGTGLLNNLNLTEECGSG